MVSGTTSLATIKLDLLTSDEQAWIVKTNSDPAYTVAQPIQFGEIAITLWLLIMGARTLGAPARTR